LKGRVAVTGWGRAQKSIGPSSTQNQSEKKLEIFYDFLKIKINF
jgi:hypothetical protein